jgi:hypothetical protein
MSHHLFKLLLCVSDRRIFDEPIIDTKMFGIMTHVRMTLDFHVAWLEKYETSLSLMIVESNVALLSIVLLNVMAFFNLAMPASEGRSFVRCPNILYDDTHLKDTQFHGKRSTNLHYFPKCSAECRSVECPLLNVMEPF